MTLLADENRDMTTAIDDLAPLLRNHLAGKVLQRHDGAYEEARTIWNARAGRRPALIARCASESDVAFAVREAAKAGVTTAIRCGGHSLAGHSTCDDGLVLDLSLMNHVTVDESARTARAEGGCLLGTIDRATQPYGLAFPAGVVSHTGASGLILGGGVGWLTRRFGLSCDNVRSYSLVTADGSTVRASEHDNRDLFWALRGGGGNFGVVTEFELNLHAVSHAVIGSGYCVGEDIGPVLAAWRDFMPSAPEYLKWSIALRIASEAERVPVEFRGRPVAQLAAVWTGSVDEGERMVDAVLALAKAQGAKREVVPFLKLQTYADSEFPHGRRYYSKSGYFGRITEQTIECLLSALERIPSPTSQIELSFQGGAADRIGSDDTAYGARGSPFLFNLLGSWKDAQQDGLNTSWVRELFASLQPSLVPGFYVNFASSDDEARVTDAYRGTRYDRLVEIKTKYDPTNFFRLNQNIVPRPSALENPR
jgi:hypothetical protein